MTTQRVGLFGFSTTATARLPLFALWQRNGLAREQIRALCRRRAGDVCSSGYLGVCVAEQVDGVSTDRRESVVRGYVDRRVVDGDQASMTSV